MRDLDAAGERRIEAGPGRDLGDHVLLPAAAGALLDEERQVDRVGAVRLGRNVVRVEVTQRGEDVDEFLVETALGTGVLARAEIGEFVLQQP